MIASVKSRRLRWTVVVFLALVVCVAVGILGTRSYLARSIQPRSGEIEIAALRAPVTVEYDEWAIPRITAEHLDDLVRAQGFVHASERLWQMELFQLTAQGRLSEVFGEAAVEVDRLMRALDIWGTSERELATLDGATIVMLQAYAEGVNARMESWSGPLPPEFLILGISPQRWKPTATIAIVRLMALDLTAWTTDLEYVAQLAELDDAHRELLRPWHTRSDPTMTQTPLDEPLWVADDLGSWDPPAGWSSAEAAPSDRTRDLEVEPPDGLHARAPDTFDPLGLLDGIGLNASNSWALAPERTADGHALLAGDTHLGLRAPSTWYLNALRTEHADDDGGQPGMDVAGLSIPGAPLVVIGMNPHVAWTFTNGNIDDSDFVVESVSADGSSYLEGDEWRPFELRRERIAVRDANPRTLTVRSTERGPVITDLFPTADLILSLVWTGLRPKGPINALLAMNRAESVDEMLEASEDFASPHQNLLVAGTEGRIAFRLVGHLPDRPPGAVGAIAFEEWEGWAAELPPEAMPGVVDPPSGYLVTANNLQSPEAWGRVAADYPIPDRARRIDEVVANATDWDVAEMAELQLDTRSLFAARYRDRAVAAAHRAGETDLAELIGGWDLSLEPESPGAAPYFAWLYRFRALVVADELGESATFPDYAFLRLMEEGDEPGSQAALWADDIRTDAIETVDRLEELALEAALPLAERAWGEVSRERSEHPLGTVELLDRLLGFNIGPYAAHGGPYTVRPVHRSTWTTLDSTSWSYPRTSTSGQSQRFIAKMDPAGPAGYFKLPTGQSGNPLDRHYRDMAPDWSSIELIELSPGPSTQAPASRILLRGRN